jgi:hypothetical protein
MPAKSLLLLPSALDACLPVVRNMCHIEQFTWSFLLFHWPVVTHVGVQDMFSMSCTIVSWPTHQSLYSFFSPSSPTSQPLSDSMISQLDHHYQLDTNTPPRPPLSYSTASPHPTETRKMSTHHPITIHFNFYNCPRVCLCIAPLSILPGSQTPQDIYAHCLAP